MNTVINAIIVAYYAALARNGAILGNCVNGQANHNIVASHLISTLT